MRSIECLLSLCQGNHECHGGSGNGNAYDDVGCQSFAKDDSADKDGSDRLEYTEHRGLRGTDVSGGYSQSGSGNDGWQDGESDKVCPISIVLDARSDVFIGYQDLDDKDDGAYG